MRNGREKKKRKRRDQNEKGRNNAVIRVHDEHHFCLFLFLFTERESRHERAQPLVHQNDCLSTFAVIYLFRFFRSVSLSALKMLAEADEKEAGDECATENGEKKGDRGILRNALILCINVWD